jgi:dynein heavy chain
LSKAIPALNAASEALKKLNKNDITEIKGFANPPAAVVMVLEAVCILLGEKSDW